MILAMRRGLTHIVALLLDKGADVNATDREGRTVLMVAVVETGDASIVSRLLERGAKVDAVDGAGRTALDMAKKHHVLEIVEILRKAVIEK